MRSRLVGLVLPVLAVLPLASACSSTARSPFDKPQGATQPAPASSNPGGEFQPDTRPDAGDNEETEIGCNPSPSRFDFPDNECDDDGDGEVDNTPSGCDEALPLTGNAEQFAAALGLCQKADDTEGRWGIVSAKYTKGYGQSTGPADGQHGILPGFGPLLKPREGLSLGVLSTGWARVFDSADGKGGAAFKEGGAMQSSSATGILPPGFPQASTGCPSIGTPHDVAVLKLEIKTPKNAKGMQFDFDFYSGEWPEFVCSTYNDGFIAYLKSAAFNGGAGDNVSFDAAGAPVSVNNAFFDRCTPNTEVGCSGGVGSSSIAACPGGSDEIAGTGFAKLGSYCGGKESTGGGATGWLTSQAPVKGGEIITLEFYIWDSGDSRYNSSVLLDNFHWIPKPVEASTGRPK